MTARLTPAVLAGLRERAKAATPGPWEWDEDGFMGCGQVYTADPDLFGGSIAGPSGDCYPRSGYRPQGDMKFIAAADPQTVEALVAEVEALRAWKASAMEVMSGLQEVGNALGVPLGHSITARATVDMALDLRNERDSLRAVVARVEALAVEWATVGEALSGERAEALTDAAGDLYRTLAPAETTGAES